MELHFDLPLVATVDDADSPGDVIDLLALVAFAAGEQPAARTHRLTRLRHDAPLLPPGAESIRTTADDRTSAHLARGDGWTLRVRRWQDDSADVLVTACSDALAAEVLAAAIEGSEHAVADTQVDVRFWYLEQRPRSSDRPVDVEPWTEIARNYTRTAQDALATLVRTGAHEVDGRILLLHGPPGTGKTTALRALAHAWRDWCRLEVVVDPEVLLGNASYLSRFLLGDDDDDGRPWRLIVLEDCDELIRAGAKEGTGQALSRLLNLADGLIGQGLRVLVAITTNEPVHHLHPAVIRPGRCLAEIEVGALTQQEALRWLDGRHAIGPGGATLAELFALRRGRSGGVVAGAAAPAGQYL